MSESSLESAKRGSCKADAAGGLQTHLGSRTGGIFCSPLPKAVTVHYLLPVNRSDPTRRFAVEGLFTVENAVALLTLTALEIVLGIDNIVFIAILVGKLPPDRQVAARRIGLGLAMLMRILLLLGISWVMGLTRELVALPAFWTAAQ